MNFSEWIGMAMVICLALACYCFWKDGFQQGISVLERNYRAEGIWPDGREDG